MKSIKLFLLALLFTSQACSQNTVCFTIEANPNPNDPALSVFSKYVNVYGCGIYAESTVSDDKVLHAAAVWAELIDNDEDGEIDDPTLLAELQANEALMPIFRSDGNAAMNTFFNNYNGDGVAAVLWRNEMDPSQPGHWGSDATVEEILHTINYVGHRNIYPDAFEISPNSSLLTAAMDIARGGQFLSVPANYPANAWYHYDDTTCEYDCMAIEYLYWMIVSNMGILDDPQTCNGIANEWEPCSPDLLQTMDVLGYALITDPAYKLPQKAPDGNYCPQSVSTHAPSDGTSFQIYPNPADNFLIIKKSKANISQVTVHNSIGQTVFSTKLEGTENQLNIKDLESGMYFLSLDGNVIKFFKS